MNLKNRIKQLEKIRNKADPEEIKIRVIWDDYIMENGEKLTIAEYNAKYKGDPDHKIVTWDDLPDQGYTDIVVKYE
jgi:hypothetical protein